MQKLWRCKYGLLCLILSSRAIASGFFSGIQTQTAWAATDDFIPADLVSVQHTYSIPQGWFNNPNKIKEFSPILDMLYDITPEG